MSQLNVDEAEAVSGSIDFELNVIADLENRKKAILAKQKAAKACRREIFNELVGEKKVVHARLRTRQKLRRDSHERRPA